MLVIRIEEWPGGSADRRRPIARVDIANRSGLAPVSDYEVVLRPAVGEPGDPAIVYGHRRDDGWLPLARAALRAVDPDGGFYTSPTAQVPADVLAVLPLAPYVSRACQTARAVLAAGPELDGLLAARGLERQAWAEEFFRSCRRSEKWTGMECQDLSHSSNIPPEPSCPYRYHDEHDAGVDAPCVCEPHAVGEAYGCPEGCPTHNHGGEDIPEGAIGGPATDEGLADADRCAACGCVAGPDCDACERDCLEGDRCPACNVPVEPLSMVLHYRAVHMGLTAPEVLTDGGPAGECSRAEGFCDAHGFHREAPEDASDLTREELQALVDDLGQEAYRAQDVLAFVREMCDAADRDGTAVTTGRLRAWLGYTGCGGVITLPEGALPSPATPSRPLCTWPSCLPDDQQQQLAADVTAGMLGEPTEPMPDPRPGRGCVEPADAPECCTWTVTTTVTAPTRDDAERWARTLRDLQLAEHGQHMQLDIAVAPVIPETPHDALLRRQFERGVAMLYAGADAPANDAGAATDVVPLADWERELLAEAQSGAPALGCDCGHEGMGASWHRDDCAWKTGSQ